MSKEICHSSMPRYVCRDFKIFITNTLSISDFVNNFKAISVDVISNSLVCLSTHLYSHGVLHIKQHAHSSYIIENDHWAKHTLFYRVHVLIIIFLNLLHDIVHVHTTVCIEFQHLHQHIYFGLCQSNLVILYTFMCKIRISTPG